MKSFLIVHGDLSKIFCSVLTCSYGPTSVDVIGTIIVNEREHYLNCAGLNMIESSVRSR